MYELGLFSLYNDAQEVTVYLSTTDNYLVENYKRYEEDQMKIQRKNWPISIACILSISAASLVNARTISAESITPSGTIYIGAFGGAGGGTSVDLVQQGTALYNYGSGSGSINNEGPLAVNSFGQSSSGSAWLAGGQIGYRWSERPLHYFSSNWEFSPAAELEELYLGRSTMVGENLTNETTRLVEHNFRVTFPLQTGIFLVNGILNAQSASLGRFKPYIGVGAGVAVISVSNANSLQTTPLEAGVNHYNSDTNDTSIAFAAQPKIGVSFNISQNTNMFVEYRFLYLSASNYIFGSTVYPTHVATSNWDVKIGSQYYNMGTVGVRFDL